jgi:hypothetical protein
MEFKELIVKTAEAEFPVSNDYLEKLVSMMLLICEILISQRVTIDIIEAAVRKWSKGLEEIRSATKEEDFIEIKDSMFKQRIIELNTMDTVSSDVRSYTDTDELKESIYYYALFLFLGLLLRIYKVSPSIIEVAMMKSNMSPDLAQKYSFDYMQIEKQKRLQVLK